MIKKLMKYLEKNYNYVLDKYVVSIPNRSIPTYKKIMFAIFGVITIVYVYDVITDSIPFMSFLIYFLAFFFLLAIPIAKNEKNRLELLIITPKYLIQRVAKKEFIVIEFDNINRLRHSNEYLTIVQKDKEIEFEVAEYTDILESLIDILEAKGKTFDQEKQYMIRPITIDITDGSIVITDIQQEDTKEEILTDRLLKDYIAVTPGYLNQVLPRNSILHDVYFEDNDLYFECSHFEIKDQHPENTTFGHIQVVDGLMVFLDSKVTSLSRKQTQERSEAYSPIDISATSLIKQLTKGIISEWRFKENDVDFIIASGVGKVRLTMSFSNCIVAWKKEKKE